MRRSAFAERIAVGLQRGRIIEASLRTPNPADVVLSLRGHSMRLRVRHTGTLVAPDDLRTSSQVVPHEGSTLEEVQKLLAEEA